jgi:hypothetical protein
VLARLLGLIVAFALLVVLVLVAWVVVEYLWQNLPADYRDPEPVTSSSHP